MSRRKYEQAEAKGFCGTYTRRDRGTESVWVDDGKLALELDRSVRAVGVTILVKILSASGDGTKSFTSDAETAFSGLALHPVDKSLASRDRESPTILGAFPQSI